MEVIHESSKENKLSSNKITIQNIKSVQEKEGNKENNKQNQIDKEYTYKKVIKKLAKENSKLIEDSEKIINDNKIYRRKIYDLEKANNNLINEIRKIKLNYLNKANPISQSCSNFTTLKKHALNNENSSNNLTDNIKESNGNNKESSIIIKEVEITLISNNMRNAYKANKYIRKSNEQDELAEEMNTLFTIQSNNKSNNINIINIDNLENLNNEEIDINHERINQSIHNETKDSNTLFKEQILKSCCLNTKDKLNALIVEKDDFIKSLQKDLERLYVKLNKQHLERIEFEKKMTIIAENQRQLTLKHSQDLNIKDDDIFVLENLIKEKEKRILHLEKELNNYYKKDFSSTKFVMVSEPNPVLCELNAEVESQKQIFKNLSQLFNQAQKKVFELEKANNELIKKDKACKCNIRSTSIKSAHSSNSNITIYTTEINEINSPNIIYLDKIQLPQLRNKSLTKLPMPRLDLNSINKKNNSNNVKIIEKEFKQTSDQLREIVCDKDKMIKILKSKINNLVKNNDTNTNNNEENNDNYTNIHDNPKIVKVNNKNNVLVTNNNKSDQSSSLYDEENNEGNSHINNDDQLVYSNQAKEKINNMKSFKIEIQESIKQEVNNLEEYKKNSLNNYQIFYSNKDNLTTNNARSDSNNKSEYENKPTTAESTQLRGLKLNIDPLKLNNIKVSKVTKSANYNNHNVLSNEEENMMIKRLSKKFS